MSSQKYPVISIIIPTNNRYTQLLTCLHAIIPQLQPNDKIIIVDNDSKATTASTVQKLHNRSIQYIHEPRPGPSYARNTGFSHAKGDIVAFLDDDCIPMEHWLHTIRKMLSHQTAQTHYVYQGSIQYDTAASGLRQELFHLRHAYDWNRIKTSYAWQKHKYIDFINAGNFFCLKKNLNILKGPFNEQVFPFIGEERDLAYRLQIQGYVIRYASHVRVRHTTILPPMMISWRGAFLYGRAQGLLEKLYLANNKATKIFKGAGLTHADKPSFLVHVYRAYARHPILLSEAFVILSVRRLLFLCGKHLYRLGILHN